MTDVQKLFFLHIRKTAGTSVRAILEKGFDRGQRCPIRSELELKLKVPTADWKTYLTSYGFIGGHYYRIAPILIPEGYRVVTLLRDPLDRAISAFNHIKNDVRDPLYKIAANLSFREALAEPKLAIEFRNAQARYLVGNAGVDFNGLSRQEKIDIALGFLENVEFFGFHELIDQAGRHIGKLVGSSLSDIPHLNRDITTKGLKRDRAVDDIAAFEANNTIDREIYCRALRIYDRRFT